MKVYARDGAKLQRQASKRARFGVSIPWLVFWLAILLVPIGPTWKSILLTITLAVALGIPFWRAIRAQQASSMHREEA